MIGEEHIIANKARKTAYRILSRAERGNRINEALHQALDGTELTSQERRFVTELVMGTTRMKRRLDADLAACYHGRYSHVERDIKLLLRLGAYQLRYMNAIPPHAALSTTVELARAVSLSRATGLINAVLRELSRRPPESVTITSGAPADDLAAAFSHPTWLVERWLDRWGRERTVALMEWNNKPPKIWLRQRNDLAYRQQLTEIATAKGLSLDPHPLTPEYVTASPSPADLLDSDTLAEGLFTVQDPSSGAVVKAVDPHPGEVIIDLCAGPGGKTAALADCVGPEGRILAYEIDHQRVGMINATIQRLGLENVDLYPGDVTTQSLPVADKILVDTPCTGTGVMARRADLRWRRSAADIREMTRIQLSLLEHAARFLGSGGTLVYATCSLEKEENSELVRTFLRAHPRFDTAPLPESVPREWMDKNGILSTFPPDHNVDGIFAVCLQLQ